VKIVYLHQYFATPDMPSVARSYEMARRFAAAGHDVHVVTAQSYRPTVPRRPSTEIMEGFTVHWVSVKYRAHMGFVRRMGAFLHYAVVAGWRARRLKADLVFATSTPLTIALPGVVAKRGRRAPMVFEVRDVWPEVPIAMGILNNPVLQWAALELERFAYRNSEAIIALSPGMAEDVARQGVPKTKITVVPNACDNERFDVSPEVGRAFRDGRPWLEDRPLVVYAGAFNRANGVGFLVRLAQAVGRLDSEIRFLIVGDGPEKASIEMLAQELGVLDKTFFIEDEVPSSSMPALMSAATVSTSLFIPVKALEDNSANKFFDTLAAGRPVAINYGGWHADLIRDHDLGVVLDSHDVEAAASSLVAFLHDEQRIDTARRAARGLAHSRFDRDRLTAVVLDVLEDVALAR
jgi:glycosyltransferase involved in cell wall biosynthesis